MLVANGWEKTLGHKFLPAHRLGVGVHDIHRQIKRPTGIVTLSLAAHQRLIAFCLTGYFGADRKVQA